MCYISCVHSIIKKNKLAAAKIRTCDLPTVSPALGITRPLEQVICRQIHLLVARASHAKMSDSIIVRSSASGKHTQKVRRRRPHPGDCVANLSFVRSFIHVWITSSAQRFFSLSLPLFICALTYNTSVPKNNSDCRR